MRSRRLLRLCLLLPLLSCTQGTGVVRGAPPPVPPPPISLPANGWSPAKREAHVLNRLAFGPSSQDLQELRRLGVAAWIQRQLDPASIPDEAVDAQLAGLRTLNLSTAELASAYPPLDVQAKQAGLDLKQEGSREQLREMLGKDELPRHIAEELVRAKLIRAIESRRQLQEVLTDFWFNHFNVSFDKGAVKWMLTPYERDAIRPHVFGTFRELLGATAHHPAMLFYLDNWLSTREGLDLQKTPGGRQLAKKLGGNQLGLNENYARELMELHTLGVDGGYTQQDVREVARAFTGWSIEKPRQQGTFVFRPRAHDPGPKVVLGTPLPAGGGQEDGERVLDLLATHPSTARFIARKLCQKFVADDPPPALVERVAGVFLRTGGRLPEVYAAIFTSPEFWSDAAYGSLTKTPFELAASAVRALGGTTDGDMALYRRIEQMGEALYRAQPPTGYPETGESWVNAGALVSRINFGLALASGRVRGTHVDVGRLVPGGAGRDPDALVDALARRLLQHPLSEGTRQTVRAALGGEDEPLPDGERRRIDPRMMAGLLLGSPEFQKQ